MDFGYKELLLALAILLILTLLMGHLRDDDRVLDHAYRHCRDNCPKHNKAHCPDCQDCPKNNSCDAVVKHAKVTAALLENQLALANAKNILSNATSAEEQQSANSTINKLEMEITSLTNSQAELVAEMKNTAVKCTDSSNISGISKISWNGEKNELVITTTNDPASVAMVTNNVAFSDVKINIPQNNALNKYLQNFTNAMQNNIFTLKSNDSTKIIVSANATAAQLLGVGLYYEYDASGTYFILPTQTCPTQTCPTSSNSGVYFKSLTAGQTISCPTGNIKLGRFIYTADPVTNSAATSIPSTSCNVMDVTIPFQAVIGQNSSTYTMPNEYMLNTLKTQGVTDPCPGKDKILIGTYSCV